MKSKVIVTLCFFASSAFAMPKTYNLDTQLSELKWVGKKVTSAHNGSVKVKEGKVTFNSDTITGGTFAIDMTSIANADITDQSYNKKLVNHLLSADFFAAENFPSATFNIEKASKIENAKAGEPNYTITGKLSIKGIENEVTFPAIISVSGNEASAKGTVTLDRTKWDIKYRSGKFFESLGDKLILDDFTVDLDLKAKAA